jgi:hypothetical protein
VTATVSNGDFPVGAALAQNDAVQGHKSDIVQFELNDLYTLRRG